MPLLSSKNLIKAILNLLTREHVEVFLLLESQGQDPQIQELVTRGAVVNEIDKLHAKSFFIEKHNGKCSLYLGSTNPTCNSAAVCFEASVKISSAHPQLQVFTDYCSWFDDLQSYGIMLPVLPSITHHPIGSVVTPLLNSKVITDVPRAMEAFIDLDDHQSLIAATFNIDQHFLKLLSSKQGQGHAINLLVDIRCKSKISLASCNSLKNGESYRLVDANLHAGKNRNGFYPYFHSKFIVKGDEVLIGSCNMLKERSKFPELALKIKSEEIAKLFRKQFDCLWEKCSTHD